MKTFQTKLREKIKFRHYLGYLLIPIILLNIPNFAFGQKQKEIIPILECVEDLGDGRFIANFGYDNPNGTEIIVPEDNSVLIYNNGNTKEKTLNKFKPGRQYKVVVKEFNGGDMCIWRVQLPNGTTKETTASVNSSHCGPSYNIEQYYPAPAGGKLNNSLIGPELTGLNKLYSTNKEVSSNDIFQISDDGDSVLIEILAVEGMQVDLNNFLYSEYGFEGKIINEVYVKGYFPIGDLLALNKLFKLIVFARPFYPAINNVGVVNTQGDKSMRSDFVKGGYGILGEGVNIGVISNSFNTKKVSIEKLTEEGLNDVVVLKDLTGNATDEGRAMVEIVRDIAPQANLFFRTGVLGPEDMAAGIHELAADCDVIVDDVTYITEPFFWDGQVAQAVNNVVNNNEVVAYFTSAGNFGSASYVSESLSPANAPKGIAGEAHDFDADPNKIDIFQNISLKPGTYTLVLQWDEPSPAQTDLDIYLSEIDGANLLGYNRVNTGGQAIEVLPFTVSGGGATTNIMVTRASGTATPRFKYIVFRGSLGFKINEYGIDGSSTITGQANAAGAITVGAVRFDKTPAFGKELKIMSYSSTGVPVEDKNKQKPDITAPNGVNTSVDLGNGDWNDDDANKPGIDTDTWPNFFGTSAAAPHAAAVAALLINANEMYNHNPGEQAETLERDDIWGYLTSTALDDDLISGVDHIMGHGFIQADAAMALIANPKPFISGIEPIGDVVEGSTVNFRVVGNYFVSSSKIYCNGTELTATTFKNSNELEGTINNFKGNPIIYVKTEAKSLSLEDGGTSEELPFWANKKKVTVLVDNEVRFFGQNNPDFTFSFLVTSWNTETKKFDIPVDDLTLLVTDMTPKISFNAPSSTDDIGIWGINAVLTGDIPFEINELYFFEFEDLPDPEGKLIFKRVENFGLLTINKLPVTITAGDKTLTYGDDLSQVNVSFTYDFNGVLTTEEEAVVMNILDGLHAGPASSNGLVVTNGIVLQNGLPLIGGSAINNGVQFISGLAIVDGWNVVVNESGDVTVTKDGVTNTILNTELDDNDYTFINEFSFYNGHLIVNARNIESGLAIVNGATIKIEDNLIVQVNGATLATGLAIVDGVPLVAGLAIVDGATIEVTNNGTIKYQGLAIVDGADGASIDGNGNGMINGTPVIAGLPIVNTAQIVSGLAMVNCNLNGAPTASGLAIINGAPASASDLAIVDGAEEVNGLTIVNGVPVVDGLAIINGVPIADGLAIVNGIGLAIVNGKSTSTANGLAIVNEGLAIVNGVPTVTGLAIINGPSGATGLALINSPSGATGLAMVNGTAYTVGLAIVNSDENGTITNAPTTASGLAMVNAAGNTEYVVVNNIGLLSAETVLNSPRTVDGLAIVDAVNHNNSSGLAIVNGGLAIVNANGEYGLAIVNKPVESGLAMVNAKSLAEGLAIVNGVPIIDGLAIVNGIRSVEGLAIVDGAPNIDGLAIVNDAAGGLAIVNGLPAVQEGVIMIMDITALQSDEEGEAEVKFVPVSMITGNTAGEHWIIPAALNSINFAPEYRPGNATINKKVVSITLSDLNSTYDGKPKQPTVTTDVPGLSVHLTYKQGDNEVMYPTDAGTYAVTATIIDSNHEGSSASELHIEKAHITITADIGYKNQGEDDPQLTYQITGLSEDIEYEITVTLDRINGEEPGVYPITITYEFVPEQDENNIDVDAVTAEFYINPWGPGTKKIRSTLMCVTEHGDGTSTAIFAWNNDNTVPVYVPHGPDNYFSPDDIADIDQLPELFPPGYGEFTVVYSGPSLTWTISSYESDHKSSTTTGADLNSPKCYSDDTKSGTIANPGIEPDITARDLNAYPNPTSGRVIIDFRNEPETNEVMVYDVMGRTHELEKTWIPSSGLELNFSDVVSGIYLVKVNNAEAIKVFRIIKQ